MCRGPLLLTVFVSLTTLSQAHAQLAPPASPGGQSVSPSATPAPLGLVPAAPVVRGRYLDVTPSVSRDTASGRVTLIADVAPRPGMHVYAPGNAGYTAVGLIVESRPGLTIGATKYPKAEEFLFAPLNERVRVYGHLFRLTRELTVAPGAAPGLVVSGRLEYQACDDKVCYLPQTVPLNWTIER